jgi:ABC-2 type transport system permease protein
MGAAVLLIKRGEGLIALVGSVLVLLGGLYYPVGTLPAPLDTLAEIVPISHAVDALRETLLTGAGVGSVADDLLPVAAFAVVGLPLAGWAVEAALDACRRRGTLGQY